MVNFERAMNHVGLSLYTDEFAAELLAWFYHFGGSNEAVVHDDVLSQALEVCARKLGFFDACNGHVNEPMREIWAAKRFELEVCISSGKPWPNWLLKILKRYKLREPKPDYDFLGFDSGQGQLWRQ